MSIKPAFQLTTPFSDELIHIGAYVVLEQVSESLMSQIFIAWDGDAKVSADGLVVIKRIHPNLVSQPVYRKLFEEELRITSALKHPRIVRILEYSEFGDFGSSSATRGSPHIVLEYIHGKSIREILEKETPRSGRGIPYPIAKTLFFEIAQAVGFIHDYPLSGPSGPRQVIHRDLTPQNVMLDESGAVKLIDFGIAKSISEHSNTHTDVIRGRAGYISPEQIDGGKLDLRSDVFSLGCLFYEILTGEKLFSGQNDFDTLEKVKNSDLVAGQIAQKLKTIHPLPPAFVANILAKCVRRNPQERYASPFQILEALDSEETCEKSQVEVKGYFSGLFQAELDKKKVSLTQKIEAARAQLATVAPFADEEVPELDYSNSSPQPIPLPPLPPPVLPRAQPLTKSPAPQLSPPQSAVIIDMAPFRKNSAPPLPDNHFARKAPSSYSRSSSPKQSRTIPIQKIFATIVLGAAALYWSHFPSAPPTPTGNHLTAVFFLQPANAKANVFVNGVLQPPLDSTHPRITLPLGESIQLKIAAPGFVTRDETLFLADESATLAAQSGLHYDLIPAGASGTVLISTLPWLQWLPWTFRFSDSAQRVWQFTSSTAKVTLPPGPYVLQITSIFSIWSTNQVVTVTAGSETPYGFNPFASTLDNHAQKSR